MRIISTVPSLTELLFYLGCNDNVVGRTKFCIHPKDEVKLVEKIGGTKNLNVEKIRALAPDLVIANKEENTKTEIEAIEEFCEVLLTEISNYSEALIAIRSIGTRLGKEDETAALVKTIENKFDEINKSAQRSVAYLIWYKPFMSIGNDTYIHSMLEKCNFKNVFDDQTRYPVVTNEDLIDAKPDYVFLSSEPFPFKQKHIDELSAVLPNTKIILVDGEMYSWYGSRMTLAADYFNQLIKEISL